MGNGKDKTGKNHTGDEPDVAPLSDDGEQSPAMANERAGGKADGTMRALESHLMNVIMQVEGQYDLDGKPHDTGSGRSKFQNFMQALLLPGDLIVLASRPAMGKTSLAAAIMLEKLLADRPVLAFYPAASGDDLTKRLLCMAGRLDRSRLHGGALQADDWERLTCALGKLTDRPLLIDATARLKIEDIVDRAYQAHAQLDGLDLLVVDYIQLLMTGYPAGPDHRAAVLSHVVRELKFLARELNVPVLVLSQLNRNLENRANKRPVMSDLRDCGSLEDDADTVMFLHRDGLANPDSDDAHIAEISIGKRRGGREDGIALSFDVASGAFGDLQEEGWD